MEKTKRFDPKEFCSFVVKYLPKEEKYLHSFNFDEEIEDMHSVLNGKENLTIFIKLTTGKGYSSHIHRRTYSFTKTDYNYNCSRMLPERDKESQIVRKIRCALYNYLDWDACPKKLTIEITQELD